MKFLYVMALLISAGTLAHAADRFLTDVTAPELAAYAAPMQVDEAQYGCGPLLQPGRSFFVTTTGDDAADGTSWDSAWATVNHALKQLQAGDTLTLGAGTYRERLLTMAAAGEPGRPIVITAAPGARVVINCAAPIGPFQASQWPYVYEAPLPELELTDVWEADSLVELQNATSLDRVRELPGTWFADTAGGRLLVHFSDGRPGDGRYVECRRVQTGMALTGAYTHLRGIWFKHGWEGVLIKGGQHNTVEDCAFFANSQHGMSIRDEANWNLVRNNYGFANPLRGTVIMHGSSHHNLLTGNRCDPSPPTVRTRASDFHYAMNNYSGATGPGNMFIGNILNDSLSFRWKPPVKGTVFERNIATGSIYSQSAAWADRVPEDRTVMRNNVMLAGIAWQDELPDSGGNGEWLDEDKVFVGNFHGAGDRDAIAAARFADPAWLDFRLQSDSPLVGAGPGGRDRGAYPEGSSRVLYVGPGGSDGNTGTSERLAFATLARTAEALQPGDTLYVMAGEYAEPFRVSASGTAEAPIVIRAYGRERFPLSGIVLDGSHLKLEGLTVSGAPGDGIRVSGEDNALEALLVTDCDGAAISTAGADGLAIDHCTLSGNRTGLALAESSDASVSNCIIALNREAQSAADAASGASFYGGNNCYFGAGAEMAGEEGSVVADPAFVDAAGGDHRLAWDSPARYLADFGRAAGCEIALSRPARIADARAEIVQHQSAVIRWETPDFDTTGAVRYRPVGTEEWRTVGDPEQGSVHAAGLVGLQPETEYEYMIEAWNRRGPGATSELMSFRTTATSREPATFCVSPDGDDSADGLAPDRAWRTIRQACFAVQPGDTVLVAPGEYHQAIAPISSGLPDARITFRRHGDGVALLTANGVLAALVSLNNRDYITIDGFDVAIGAANWVVSPHLMDLTNCRGVEILNCRRHISSRHDHSTGADENGHWAGSGLHVIGCSDLRIEGNVIWGARYLVRLFDCEGVLIRGNTFALKSVVAVQIGETGDRSGVRFVNNLLHENRSFRNTFFWLSPGSTFESDYNLYFTTDPALGIGTILAAGPDPAAVAIDLPQWREMTGQEQHSIVADPVVISVDERDFRLQPGSPAIGAGDDGGNIGALGMAPGE